MGTIRRLDSCATKRTATNATENIAPGHSSIASTNGPTDYVYYYVYGNLRRYEIRLWGVFRGEG
jgi:hypothetical protein